MGYIEEENMEFKSKAYVTYEDYLAQHPELNGVEEEAKILQKYEDEFFGIIAKHVG